MTKRDIEERYFKWICEVMGKENSHKYSKLLRYLFDREFEYSIDKDENRAIDGIELRHRFGRIKDIPFDIVDNALDYKPCSVLEMLAALCIRIEESIMANPQYGDRTAYWFWDFIFNLGLKNMYDENFKDYYVEVVINRFLKRDYASNGRGGLVVVYRPGVDLRAVEIWYQVQWYLSEFEE